MEIKLIFAPRRGKKIAARQGLKCIEFVPLEEEKESTRNSVAVAEESTA